MERYKKSQKPIYCAAERGKVMLWQIKAVLHCHFPDLSGRLGSLSDPRKGIHYRLEELLMSAVVLFLLKNDSRNDFNHKSRDECFSKNYYRLFRLRLPGMDAVNDLMKQMEEKELEGLCCRLINGLIEKRVFHKLRFCDKRFYLMVDGTGVYHWSDWPSEDISRHAIKKVSSTGKESWSSQVLEAALVFRGGMTIPLCSEWIDNKTDGAKNNKQDCELNAFKRLAVQVKNYFPRLDICVVADGLYSSVAIMDICKEYDWRFITVFKDGNLPCVWQEVESLLPLDACLSRVQCLGDSTHQVTRNYRWIKDIEHQKHKVHWIECVQERVHRRTGGKTVNRFVFLTNLDVDSNNVAHILMAGRARWDIEDYFNTQKNRGGALHHKFNRKCFKAVKNWHSIRRLACLIIELVEYTRQIQGLLKEHAKMTLKELWKNLNSYLSMCPADTVMAEFEHWSKDRRQVRLQ